MSSGGGTPTPTTHLEEISWQRVTNIVMASDSIVVYSGGDTHLEALAVTAAVRRLIVAGFRSGIALRCALAIGELDELDIEGIATGGDHWTARFSGLIGLGLVRAYELESVWVATGHELACDNAVRTGEHRAEQRD
jgi:hypothetical protein